MTVTNIQDCNSFQLPGLKHPEAEPINPIRRTMAMRMKFFFQIVAAVIFSVFATAQTTPASPQTTLASDAPPALAASPASTLPDFTSVAPRPAPTLSLTNEQIKDLIRRSADHDLENDRKQRDYTYIQRAETHSLEKDGQVKKNESETTEVMVLYGEQVERTIAKNDQPLSEKDAAKEEKKIQELIEKRKNESDSDRQKRLARKEKDRDDARRFVQEIADAFDFTYRGIENVAGHSTYVIDCEPRRDYQPRQKEAKYLTKFRGRVWIDTAESQLVKMDAEAIDTVSWGLFLARIHKGSHIFVEQTRVNDEVWLPKHVAIKLDAKLALLKTFRMDIDIAFKDYKKFGSTSRIVSIGAPITEQTHPQ